MRNLRVLSYIALSTIVCGPALAVGKITVDPNTAASAAPQALASADVRLARKVTYEARYASVQRIIEDLSTATGIKLYAGSGKSDWPVRSRKMNIFVKDVRMADLMNSIAHVMKFKWSPNYDLNPPTYRLVVDKKAAAAADAQKARAESKREGQIQERRQEWIDLIMKYGAKSLPEMQSFRETDPMLYEQTRFGISQGLHALFTEVPETKSRYAAGRSFRISSDKLSAETKSLIYDSANNLKEYLQRSRGEELIGLRDMLKPEYTFDVACGRLDIESFTPNLRWGGGSVGTTGYFRVERDAQDYEIGCLPRRDSEWERYRSVAHYKVLDGIAPKDAWATTGDPGGKLQADLKKEEELLYPSEPTNEHQAFDELEKAIKLIMDTPGTDPNPELIVTAYIAIVQKALADATGFGVVSDSWACANGVRRMPGQEVKLSELLDKISEQYNYNWNRSSAILEFRHRMWWKNRLNQISDDRVAAWSENTSKNGILSLDDLAQISTLNYDQAEESLKPDKVLGTAGIYRQILETLDTNGNLHWLRLYSSLSPQLRALLAGQGGATSDGGINGHMLTSEQWKLAQTMFDRIGASRGDAIFRLDLIPRDNKDVTYRFSEIDNETGEEDRIWKVTLPRYTPPAGEGIAKR